MFSVKGDLFKDARPFDLNQCARRSDLWLLILQRPLAEGKHRPSILELESAAEAVKPSVHYCETKKNNALIVLEWQRLCRKRMYYSNMRWQSTRACWTLDVLKYSLFLLKKTCSKKKMAMQRSVDNAILHSNNSVDSACVFFE